MLQKMKNWNEIQTAYQVAKLGTVSAAASALDVHRATVIRHIDMLEEILGEKIFHRHTKGYVPTELGMDLMRVAGETEERFNQLMGKAKSYAREISGDLIITSIDVAAPIIVPVLYNFQRKYPNLTLRMVSSEKLLRLEYGEAHIALRFGPKPDHPDYVVQHLTAFEVGLYASKDYIAKHGLPKTQKEYQDHLFIGFINFNESIPIHMWIQEKFPPNNIIFKSTSPEVINQAVIFGVGIGFLPVNLAEKLSHLVEVIERDPSWSVPVWLVTHVDLHRSTKVQAFVKFLKDKDFLAK